MGANKKHPVRTVLIALLAVIIVLIILSIVGYIFNWSWTGLGSYISAPHPKDSDFQRGKTLWDWLQLLIIPAVLAVAGYVINLTISKSEQEATKQRDKTEREITKGNQCEAALQAYIDKMSELLLKENLRESRPEDEVRTIARSRTLTVLPDLDSKRKDSILQFLHESGLINKDNCMVDLRGANLSEADLSGSDLSGACLRQANLIGAILSGATLVGVNLNRAQLCGATLIGANLSKADLSKAELQLNLEEQIRTSWKKFPYLHKTILIGANLSGANLSGAYLTGVHLSGANLSGTNLSEAILMMHVNGISSTMNERGAEYAFFCMTYFTLGKDERRNGFRVRPSCPDPRFARC